MKAGWVCLLLILPTILTAANEQTKQKKESSLIKKGSKVTLHYTLTVDGNVVDSSLGKGPFSYVQGSRQVIPGLEEQMAGLKPGDKKDVSIAPEKGYGPVMRSAFQKVPRKELKHLKTLKVGDVVNGQMQGQAFRAVVSELDKKEVTLNLNHPLAGKHLKFNVEVLTVENVP